MWTATGILFVALAVAAMLLGLNSGSRKRSESLRRDWRDFKREHLQEQ